MSNVQKTLSPVDGSVYVERELADDAEIGRVLERAERAQCDWSSVPLGERIEQLTRAIDAFVADRDELAGELTWQMGRPIAQVPGEIAGFEERARGMLSLAPEALADVRPTARDGFQRFVRRSPLGVVLVLAPWNYPYLTSVNSIWPALAAGNAVVLKHSHQTPLCAERLSAALRTAGLPDGLLEVLVADHAGVERCLSDPIVSFCAFTGSVAGGHAVQRALSSRFASSGLELGGKDPAYVRADADLDHALPNLLDGTFFNSGQSCCGIERIYVHASRFGDFVEDFVEQARAYELGDPTVAATTLGPMVRTSAADYVRGQISEAVAAGARALDRPSGLRCR